MSILARLLCVLVPISFTAVCCAFDIATGPRNGTYFAMASDLVNASSSKFALHITAKEGLGSVQNVKDLRHSKDVKLAFVQSDVYQELLDLARVGDTEVSKEIDPLRVVLPLHAEEVHIIVTADSKIREFKELIGQKVFAGNRGSGSRATFERLYKLLLGVDPILVDGISLKFPAGREYAGALNVLLDRTGSVDAVVVVGGQPLGQLKFHPEVGREQFRLIEIPWDEGTRQKLGGTYFKASIHSASYAWVATDVSTVAVRSYLVTFDYKSPEITQFLRSFSELLCTNRTRLKSEGHPKWKSVEWINSGELMPLETGWQYYSGTSATLRACAKSCTPRKAQLGFCEFAGNRGK